MIDEGARWLAGAGLIAASLVAISAWRLVGRFSQRRYYSAAAFGVRLVLSLFFTYVFLSSAFQQ